MFKLNFGRTWPLAVIAVTLLFIVPSLAGADTLSLAGLKQPVQVRFDSEGVWHLTAQNDEDAAFAEGYLHARDRFFEMDFTRRLASGTLGELLGMAALSQDIELRTLGLRRAARRSWSHYDPHTRAILLAYANGVNAWLANNPLPPEYGALELTQAEPWSPVDSIVVAKALAFQLSFDLDIDRTIQAMAYQQAGQIGGFDGQALFFEDTNRSQPFDDRISIPGFLADHGIVGKSAARPPLKQPRHDLSYLAGDTLEAAKDYSRRVADIPFIANTMKPRENRGASNWWVVSGEHTASGAPILSNDPHLSLNMPPVFTEGHIVVQGSDPMNVTGTAIPGAPGIILGCTTRVCWGATTNPMDVTDTFSDPIVTDTFGFPAFTVYKGKREPIVWVFQSYYVNNPGDGEADNLSRAPVPLDGGGITFVVPRRNYGPILSIQGDTALTVQYTGWGPTQELRTFLTWNRARNLSDFQQGLKWFDFGSQNWSYADVDGNIAYFTSGEMPLRRDLQRDNAPAGGVPPFLIRDGSNPKHQWLPAPANRPAAQATANRVLPADEMPHVINPASGYIANANNDPVGTTLDNNPLNQLRPGGGLYYLNPGYSSLRIGRIDRVLNSLIDSGQPITRADMEALQANNQLLDAQLVAPFIVQAFQHASSPDASPVLAQFASEPAIGGAVQLLGQWDFSTPTGLTDGYGRDRDPGTPPGAQEIADSAAATIFSAWRGRFLANTIDGIFDAIGLGDFKPGSTEAYTAMAYQLMHFSDTHGLGASGIPFFNVPGVSDPAVARDVILLKSLADALELLGSEEFAPAFGDASTLTDFRWGKLHRIVFDHPLGGPFNAPPAGGLMDVAPSLPGVARPGGFQSVDAASHSTRADGLNDFMFGSGPSRRFIGEMKPSGVQLEQILPGGESGVVASPFYANQLGRWLTNEYKPLVIDPGKVSAVDTLTLQPAN